ncbi:hypothetical protein PIB30_093331, partial [Stylosanthes scabra]|nr:hypothetical protein [Stylosanthes scabra]
MKEASPVNTPANKVKSTHIFSEEIIFEHILERFRHSTDMEAYDSKNDPQHNLDAFENCMVLERVSRSPLALTTTQKTEKDLLEYVEQGLKNEKFPEYVTKSKQKDEGERRTKQRHAKLNESSSRVEEEWRNHTRHQEIAMISGNFLEENPYPFFFLRNPFFSLNLTDHNPPPPSRPCPFDIILPHLIPSPQKSQHSRRRRSVVAKSSVAVFKLKECRDPASPHLIPSPSPSPLQQRRLSVVASEVSAVNAVVAQSSVAVFKLGEVSALSSQPSSSLRFCFPFPSSSLHLSRPWSS